MNDVDSLFEFHNVINSDKVSDDGSKKKKKTGGFQSMGLSKPVFSAIVRKGYKVPTPIQRKAIPPALEGRDIVAMARTGSGKTAAFLIPMFEKLKCHTSKVGVRALILSPTRELALQTDKFCRTLGKYTDLKFCLLVGGDSMEQQFSALAKNPDVIIATPGRLVHVMTEAQLGLKVVEYLVFDEADRLFEMGFEEQIREIMHAIPEGKQTLLFSATLPSQVANFSRAGLCEPVTIRLDANANLSDKLTCVFLTLKTHEKLAVLMHIVNELIPSGQQTIVFASTRHHVEYLHHIFEKAGVLSSMAYGKMDQMARKIAIGKFRAKKTSLLIVTDVAARGIDLPLLDNVINYDFPPLPKLFIHRAGRVARAGRSGTAYSLAAPDEVAFMIDLFSFIDQPMLNTKAENKEQTKQFYYGTVPSQYISTSMLSVKNLSQDDIILEGLERSMTNAKKLYCKTRASATVQANKQAKIICGAAISVHPIFGSENVDSEKKKQDVLQSLRSFRPPQTILELGAPNSTMQAKRKSHAKFTAKHQAQENLAGLDDDISSRIPVEMKSQLSIVPNRPSQSFRDEKFFISNEPTDTHEKFVESSYRLDTDNKAIDNMTMDLTMDEVSEMRTNKDQLKWDRKRKKFSRQVGGKESQSKKRIRTESGQKLPTSYKTDIYEKWKKKTKQSIPTAGTVEENSILDAVEETRRQYRHNAMPKPSSRQKGVKDEVLQEESVAKNTRVTARRRQIQSHNIAKNKSKVGAKRSHPPKNRKKGMGPNASVKMSYKKQNRHKRQKR